MSLTSFFLFCRKYVNFGYIQQQVHLFNYSFNVFSVSNRLAALKALLQSLNQAEDIIKVHEARLTEKETSSLDIREVENYRITLKV